jgi:hypothetical protein
MTEQVVHALEVVDVDQAERERDLACLGTDELPLYALLERAVVPEAGQRVGQCETHRSQRLVCRALVERDREQRPDERGGEERRALPEHDEHQGGGRHQGERNDRRARRRLHERGEGAARRARDGGRDEDEVDRVLGGRGQ